MQSQLFQIQMQLYWGSLEHPFQFIAGTYELVCFNAHYSFNNKKEDVTQMMN